MAGVLLQPQRAGLARASLPDSLPGALPEFPDRPHLGRVIRGKSGQRRRPDIDSADVGTIFDDDIVPG